MSILYDPLLIEIVSTSEIVIIFVFSEEDDDSEPEENGGNAQVFVAYAFLNV